MLQNFPLPVAQEVRRPVTAAAVWLLALSWRMMEFCTNKCRRFLLSPCDYNLFAKVKEPLRGTRYSTRDELICAMGWSIRNINKDGRADGEWRLPNIWQTVINKGEVTLLSVVPLWIKPSQKYPTFSSKPCIISCEWYNLCDTVCMQHYLCRRHTDLQHSDKQEGRNAKHTASWAVGIISRCKSNKRKNWCRESSTS